MKSKCTSADHCEDAFVTRKLLNRLPDFGGFVLGCVGRYSADEVVDAELLQRQHRRREVGAEDLRVRVVGELLVEGGLRVPVCFLSLLLTQSI